jgi:hypothetical protein
VVPVYSKTPFDRELVIPPNEPAPDDSPDLSRWENAQGPESIQDIREK